MKRYYLSLLLVCALAVSCSSTKTLKFTQKTDEIVSTQSLKDFLKENKNPKVVLRVRDATLSVTEKGNNDYLYNAIENQLLASGFVVRDRQLFNQIIENNENNIDYKKLKEKSDTELIIELTKIDPEIVYETNKFYDKNDKEKIENNSFIYKKYGASVEFKVVMINSNEFAGIYKFNYTPCVKGCIISQSVKEMQKDKKAKAKETNKGYEGVAKNDLEAFMKDATKKLVEEMRK